MGRHTFLSVLAVTLIALALAIFLPSGRAPTPNLNKSSDYPWNITVDKEGVSHVFGVAIGRSSIGEMVQKLQEPPETSMFVAPDGKMSVELYFDHVTLGELKARMVIAAGLDQVTLKSMYERGVRISSLAGGVRKVQLNPDDLALVNKAPIASLTYLPGINLDAEIAKRRFGIPAQRLKEKESGLVHWLYPAIGLDLTMSDEGKEVLLFVPPSEFDKVVGPLRDKTEALPVN